MRSKHRTASNSLAFVPLQVAGLLIPATTLSQISSANSITHRKAKTNSKYGGKSAQELPAARRAREGRERARCRYAGIFNRKWSRFLTLNS